MLAGRVRAGRQRHRGLAHDEGAAGGDIDIHAAVFPFDDIDVGELGKLTHECRLLVLQMQARAVVVGRAERPVERGDAIGERVDLIDGRDDLAIGVGARLRQPIRRLAKGCRERLSLLEHVAPRHRRRRIVGETREAVEELGEPCVDRAAGAAERRLHVAERAGERRFAMRAADLALQPAFEQAIALRADAEHLDAAAGAARRLRRHGAEIDDAPRVARRVDVGDVLAGDVEPVALRLERAGG